jgi:hypothetical protein
VDLANEPVFQPDYTTYLHAEILDIKLFTVEMPFSGHQPVRGTCKYSGFCCLCTVKLFRLEFSYMQQNDDNGAEYGARAAIG